MAANAWDSATPVNANTVKDTVPDEFQALKIVNIRRQRFWGNGLIANPTYNFSGAGPGPFFNATPIRYNSTLLTAGSFDTALGEYTCDIAGYYNVVARGEALAIPNAQNNMVYEYVAIQKYSGGSWSNIAVERVVPNSWAPGIHAEGIVLLAAGEKLRAIQGGRSTSSYGSGTYLTVTESLQYMFGVEFLKTP